MKRDKLTVLLVEDNEDDRIIVRESLQGVSAENFELIWVERLAPALDLLCRQTVDVILLDLGLPDSGGLESLIKITQKAPDLPVVVFTGLQDEAMGLEAIKRGAQDYLVKGQINTGVIQRVVQYAIERKRVLVMKDHFVNIASHEIQGPLGTLREILKQFLEGLIGPVNENQQKFLNMGLRVVERMSRTVSSLLALAKMESGKVELKKGIFNFAGLAQEILQSFQFLIPGKKVDLRMICLSERVDLYADRDKIAQVFTNLIHNALKFTLQGRIEVEIRDRGDEIFCSVADTGTGIPEENLAEIFNKYAQFGKKSAAAESGAGLGLSICKEIIELHGGKIGAESKPQKGTKIFFSLPKR